MIRNRDRYGSTIDTPLHDYVTASLLNDLEAVLFKDSAHVPAGKDTGAYPCAASKRMTKTLRVKPAFYFSKIGTF